MPRPVRLMLLAALLTVGGSPALAHASSGSSGAGASAESAPRAGVGWRSEVGAGLPHLVATAHGVTLGGVVAIGPFAALTLPLAPSARVAPVVGGVVDARVRDWQLVRLEVRMMAAAAWRSGAAVPRFGVTTSLVRSDAGVQTRFGVGALLDDPGGAATVLPMVTIAWRFGAH